MNSCYVCLSNKSDCKHIYSINNCEYSMAYFKSDEDKGIMFKDLNCKCLKSLLTSNNEKFCCVEDCNDIGSYFCMSCHYKFCGDCNELNGNKHRKLENGYYIESYDCGMKGSEKYLLPLESEDPSKTARSQSEKNHILYPKNFKVNSLKFNKLFKECITVNSKINYLIGNKAIKYEDSIKYGNIITKSSTKIFDEIIKKKKIISSKVNNLKVMCGNANGSIDKCLENEYSFVLNEHIKLRKYFNDLGVDLNKTPLSYIIANNFFVLPRKKLIVFVINDLNSFEIETSDKLVDTSKQGHNNPSVKTNSKGKQNNSNSCAVNSNKKNSSKNVVENYDSNSGNKDIEKASKDRSIKIMSINLNCEKCPTKKNTDTNTAIKNNTMNKKNLKTISSLISLSKIFLENTKYPLYYYVKIPSKYILYNYLNTIIQSSNNNTENSIVVNIPALLNENICMLVQKDKQIVEESIFSIENAPDQQKDSVIIDSYPFPSRIYNSIPSNQSEPKLISSPNPLKLVKKVLNIRNLLIVHLKEQETELNEINYYKYYMKDKDKSGKFKSNAYLLEKSVAIFEDFYLIDNFKTPAITLKGRKHKFKANQKEDQEMSNSIFNPVSVSVILSYQDRFEIVSLPEYLIECRVDTLDYLIKFIKFGMYDKKYQLDPEPKYQEESFITVDKFQLSRFSFIEYRDYKEFAPEILNLKNVFIKENILDALPYENDFILILTQEGKIKVFTKLLLEILNLNIDFKVSYFQIIHNVPLEEEMLGKFDDVLREIVSGCIKNENFDEADEFFKSSISNHDKSTTYIVVISKEYDLNILNLDFLSNFSRDTAKGELLTALDDKSKETPENSNIEHTELDISDDSKERHESNKLKEDMKVEMDGLMEKTINVNHLDHNKLVQGIGDKEKFISEENNSTDNIILPPSLENPSVNNYIKINHIK